MVCSLANFLKNLMENGTDIEFIYLRANGKWLFSQRHLRCYDSKKFSEFKEV